MATIATMAMLKPAKILARSPSPSTSGKAPSVSLLRSLEGASKKGISVSSSAPAAAAIAGAFFSALASSDAAVAAQQIPDVAAAADDNRGLALLLPLAPAIAWVLYNILQPALNQLNRMRSEQVLVAGLGVGGAAALALAPEASAAAAAAESSGDNRGLLLLFVVLPAIAWVLFNILQPALNQLNRMRSD